MLQKVKSTLHRDLVLYNEDHHPNHIVCFCPQFFLRVLCNMWDDPSVFKSLESSPEEWRQKILDQIPAHLSRRYSWSFSKSALLPRGTVFLKRKKQFAKGRTIISYSQHAKRATIVGIPPKHWAKPSAEAEVEWNDDIVGFCNAVPRRDILRSVQIVVREYHQLTGCSVLSVPGNPRGRTKSNLRRCWIADIPDIVELSFTTGVFTAAGKCRLQIEGTCIGNQISPVGPILAGLPVLMAEKSFLILCRSANYFVFVFSVSEQL
eukprot:s2796_g5.t1